MKQSLSLVALLVNDYDEAIRFYLEKLNFHLIEDRVMSPAKRWVVISPPGGTGCHILLTKAASAEQASRVGNQTGGRVFLFLETDDFERDYNNLLKHHLRIVSEPRDEDWGRVAVFADLYGNLWDLVGRRQTEGS